MSGKKKKTSEKVNIEENKDSISIPEEDDIDAALSASLDGLYENDFVQTVEPAENDGSEMSETPVETEFGNVSDNSENTGFSDESSELADFPNEKIEQDSTAEFTEEDVALIDDISEALAVQIKSDLKKNTRKKDTRSFWWLLTLIPFLGVLVLFFKRLRKDMPKVLMLLRAIIFLAFAILIIGSVATEGRLDYYLLSAYTTARMDTIEPENKVLIPTPEPEIPGLHKDDQYINSLVTIRDSKSSCLMQVVISYNPKSGVMSLFPVQKPLSEEQNKLKFSFEKEYLVKLNCLFEIESDGLVKLIDRLGGIDINLSQNEIDDLKVLDVKGSKELQPGLCTLKGQAVYTYMKMLGRTLETMDGNESSVVRQANVYKAIFTKLDKTENIVLKAYAMNAPLKWASTDLSLKTFFNYIESIGNNGIYVFKQEIFNNVSSGTDLRKLVYGLDFEE